MKPHLTAIAICAALTLAVFVWINAPKSATPAKVTVTPVSISTAESSSSGPAFVSSLSPSHKVTEPSSGTMDFSLPSTGLSDKALTLANFQGKPTLIYVFLATCPHCRSFYPNLEILAKKYASEGLQTVMLCGTRSTALELEDFKNTVNPTLPMLQDVDKSFQEKYNISMIPTVFLVNASGQFKRFDYNQLNELDSAIPSVLGR